MVTKVKAEPKQTRNDSKAPSGANEWDHFDRLMKDYYAPGRGLARLLALKAEMERAQ